MGSGDAIMLDKSSSGRVVTLFIHSGEYNIIILPETDETT